MKIRADSYQYLRCHHCDGTGMVSTPYRAVCYFQPYTWPGKSQVFFCFAKVKAPCVKNIFLWKVTLKCNNVLLRGEFPLNEFYCESFKKIFSSSDFRLMISFYHSIFQNYLIPNIDIQGDFHESVKSSFLHVFK